VKSHNPFLLKKLDFLASKTLLDIPLGHKEKSSLSTLNAMILQTVINECVRCKHTVSYKLLQLEAPKEAPILHNPPFFQ
jgi:hypothetical protein